MEFEKRFSTDQSCALYLRQLRWPEGFACPVCQSKRFWETNRSSFFCADCKRQTSVTAGTIFDRTKIPLRLWFRAAWLVTSEKNGISALGLQRQLGLSRYETAWLILGKLRRAMVRPGRESLSGEVEVDETFIGGVDPNGGRRHIGYKALVAMAVEIKGEGMGRVRLHRIRDSSAKSLKSFIKQAVAPGSAITTDGWQGYAGLVKEGYLHTPYVVQGKTQNKKLSVTLLPRVHRVASLLKRWLLGTHQGGIDAEQHLEEYLDEFTFRFNRRTSASRGKLFYRLIQQATEIGPASTDCGN